MTSYDKFVNIIAKWPFNSKTKNFNYGYFLRQLLKNTDIRKNIFPGNALENLEKFNSLSRLVNNVHGNKYPSQKKVGASGLPVQHLDTILSDEFLDNLSTSDLLTNWTIGARYDIITEGLKSALARLRSRSASPASPTSLHQTNASEVPSPSSPSPQKGRKMTIIEKGPSKVETPLPGELRPVFGKAETRRDLRSPEMKEKTGRRDSDLISTATSALRRLHFRSAGGSRPKRGQTATSGGQNVPKLMLMGSSTASETTTNTSTDSSNTVYTMVTVTDAEQEERLEHELLESKTLLKDEKLAVKSVKENSDIKKELKERKHEIKNREILNEFDELFLENEKRINAERKLKGRNSKNGVKYCKEIPSEKKRESPNTEPFGGFNLTTVTIEDAGESRKSKLCEDNGKREKRSSESEEEKRIKNFKQEDGFLKAGGSSSERDSDDIFSSVEEQLSVGPNAPPPTPLTGTYQKEQHFFSKTTILDEETIRHLESVVENGNRKLDADVKSEKPVSNIRTIHSELPQRTFSSNFNKRKKVGGDQEDAKKNQLEVNRISSPKPSPKSASKTSEDSLFPFPPRSGSPKPISRSSSPKLKRDISTSLKKLADISSPLKIDKIEGQNQERQTEVAALTLSNLEKHEKQISEELMKHSKYESILNMDSPTTLKSSPPVENFFNPASSNSKFEFPSCTSPTEITNMFVCEDPEDSNRENNSEPNKHINEKKEEKEFSDNHNKVNNKRKKRNDRKSISVETPLTSHDGNEKPGQNRKSKDGFHDTVSEAQNRKYSILTTDGSIKNFVSENSEEFIKTSKSVNKENITKKKSGNRRSSETPQRHRRVSIIQGESLRHFIFEEPDTSRMKPSKHRKVSKVLEDTTRNLLLEEVYSRKSSLVPGDTLRNLLGDESPRKSSIAPEEKPRKFSINTLGDIVSARKFSLLPPGEIYTSQIDGKTTEIIKLAPGTKGRPLATIVVQQASIQRGSISGPSGQKEDSLLDVANTFTLEELHEFDMKYGSPHHCRSQSVKTPGRSCGRPNYLCLPQQRSRVASMPNTGVEEEYYRLRHFSITGKGVVNRGDSLKSRRSRSNNSVASSNSSHSTEHLPTNMGTVGSHPGSARTSAECSLASSRESSTTSVPYKVVMLGSAGVGKSSLISQFMTSEYLHAYDTSLDEEYGEKSVSVLLDGEESELIFVDHPSAEMSPENCITTYQPQAYIIVYSVVDRSSFQIAEETLQSLWKTDSIGSKAVILVGNKTDLVRSRTISSEEGKNMARSYDCKFIETSVGINHNVDELLVGILTQIRLKIQQANKPKRNKSPLGRCIGKDGDSPKKWRNSRLSASLKVKGLLGRVWARDSKSKSCELLTDEELSQLKNYKKDWLRCTNA